MIGKTETTVVLALMALGYGESVDKFEKLKNGMIDYYCDHYQNLALTDDGDFNSPEVYEEIFKTCDELRAVTIRFTKKKEAADIGNINLNAHLKKTSELRKQFFKDFLGDSSQDNKEKILNE